MAANFNQVTLAGNIGKLDLFTTASGMNIATIGLAITKYKKVESGFEDSTTWITLKLFGMMADRVMNSNVVGDNILITGELDTSSYESDGVKKYQTYVVVNKVQTCKYGKNNPKSKGAGSGEQANNNDSNQSFNMKYKNTAAPADEVWGNEPF